MTAQLLRTEPCAPLLRPICGRVSGKWKACVGSSTAGGIRDDDAVSLVAAVSSAWRLRAEMALTPVALESAPAKFVPRYSSWAAACFALASPSPLLLWGSTSLDGNISWRSCDGLRAVKLPEGALTRRVDGSCPAPL